MVKKKKAKYNKREELNSRIVLRSRRRWNLKPLKRVEPGQKQWNQKMRVHKKTASRFRFRRLEEVIRM